MSVPMSKVLVLDGGMGHLLRRMGVQMRGEIGSVERFLGVALANIEQPELVVDAHEQYLKAGANVVTTNSYACVPKIVGNNARTVETIRAAGALAKKAAARHSAYVAGCLPPLNASYRPDLVLPEAEMQEQYKIIAEEIAPFSDVLLCETMSCAREAAAAVSAASAVANGKEVWVSWALAEDSDKLLSGESIGEAVAAISLREGGPVKACLFNCSHPERITAALPQLQALLPKGVTTGAYANGFRTVKSPGGTAASEYREDLTPEVYATAAAKWVSDGSTIVGGCCGVFPEHIEAVASILKKKPAQSSL
eukprot:gnl/TRDRNA2_/TRDRNA2_82659_c0_seq3.p1 gnl/TRDRNA2_/TRDRNA2_82659_c0~~gnl/TRDRNA2_/TRDRNA2_82659_c0_seq3.p1  ORF type:complete len:309 (-),score=77.64 gnl/TRDRNA2_/TRDRNA2_82659_c0_seq3:132-1058(-)